MKTSSDNRRILKTPRFSRDVKKFSLDVQKEAFEVAQKLGKDIFDSSLNIKRMVGLKGTYRVVILIDYRMIFSFDKENVYLLRIGHRREIYRNLEL